MGKIKETADKEPEDRGQRTEDTSAYQLPESIQLLCVRVQIVKLQQ